MSELKRATRPLAVSRQDHRPIPESAPRFAQPEQPATHAGYAGQNETFHGRKVLTLYIEISRSIRRILAVGVVTVASGVVAVHAQQQKTEAAADSETVLQEVVVTGSLIKRANAETAEAITIIKADSLKDQGIVNVEQALNTLTSNTPSRKHRPIHRDVYRRRYLRQPARPGQWPHPGAA